jgi:hypothetical protein
MMTEKRKRKRDLYATFQHIERYHQRRSIFTLHVVFSLVIQGLMWVNWYASYAAKGVGFENNFFADRIIISGALAIFLVGHYALMYLAESKDRLVIEALRQHQEEVDAYDDDEATDNSYSQEAVQRLADDASLAAERSSLR